MFLISLSFSLLSNALHLFWNVFITRLPCQKFCPHRGRIVLGCFATRTRIQWSPNQWWKWKRVSFPTGEQLRLINISNNDSLPSVPFEMIMGSNAFFMFFNYKNKNTKTNFFFYFIQNRPRGFSVKKMGGKGEGLGSRLILSLSYIRVILSFSTVITTSFPSLLPTSNSPKIASNLVCFGPWGYREPWKQWAAFTTYIEFVQTLEF